MAIELSTEWGFGCHPFSEEIEQSKMSRMEMFTIEHCGFDNHQKTENMDLLEAKQMGFKAMAYAAQISIYLSI